MHHKIFAKENTSAQICVSKSETDLDECAQIIIKAYNQRGWIAIEEMTRDNGMKMTVRHFPSGGKITEKEPA